MENQHDHAGKGIGLICSNTCHGARYAYKEAFRKKKTSPTFTSVAILVR